MNRVDRAPWLFPEGARLGEENALLHALARRHRVTNYSGPLSIKTVLEERSPGGRVQSLAPPCRQALAPSTWEEDFLSIAWAAAFTDPDGHRLTILGAR
jgi:hypothetical protein